MTLEIKLTRSEAVILLKKIKAKFQIEIEKVDINPNYVEDDYFDISVVLNGTIYLFKSTQKPFVLKLLNSADSTALIHADMHQNCETELVELVNVLRKEIVRREKKAKREFIKSLGLDPE